LRVTSPECPITRNQPEQAPELRPKVRLLDSDYNLMRLLSAAQAEQVLRAGIGRLLNSERVIILFSIVAPGKSTSDASKTTINNHAFGNVQDGVLSRNWNALVNHAARS
jgi:hypothetical protein